MPKAPEDLIRSMYEAFSALAEQRTFDSYVETYYEPDGEYEPVEEGETVLGHSALVRWHERWFDAWDELHAHPDELTARDEVVFTAVSVRGRGTGSGTEITQRFFHVTEVRNGRIIRMREYLDRDEAIAAAGLPG